MLYSVIYGWVGNHTNYNILLAILMHATEASVAGLVTCGSTDYPAFWALPNSLLTGVLLIAVLLLLAVTGPALGRIQAPVDHKHRSPSRRNPDRGPRPGTPAALV